jgi:2-deoxy-D-gluconate 3-dehydrogenase
MRFTTERQVLSSKGAIHGNPRSLQSQGQKRIGYRIRTGLGAGMAIAFAQAGANVTLHNYDKVLDSTIEEVKKTGVKYICRSGDVCDKRSPYARGRHGQGVRLDRHSGQQRRHHPPRARRRALAEFWNTVINTNLNSVWFLSQYAGRLMLAQGHGKIINTASLLTFQGGITGSRLCRGQGRGGAVDQGAGQ